MSIKSRRGRNANYTMLRNYYINKGWMVSEAAQRTYRVTAIISLVLFLMLVAVPLAGTIPEARIPLLKLLLLISVVGAAITTVAMEYFLFGFDKSSASKKVFWFCVMLFPPLGPALYYFIVYSRSDVLIGNSGKQVEPASA